jgi:hypothetical protein
MGVYYLYCLKCHIVVPDDGHRNDKGKPCDGKLISGFPQTELKDFEVGGKGEETAYNLSNIIEVLYQKLYNKKWNADYEKEVDSDYRDEEEEEEEKEEKEEKEKEKEKTEA